MDRINLVNTFLKLILEISKNDIEIDSNIVYSNLSTFNLEKKDTTYYYETWINNFEKFKNLNIIKHKSYIEFSSFNFNNNDKKIKLYIPFNKKDIYKAVNELIKLLTQNNINHLTKVFNSVRNDNVIVIVDDLFTAEKIRKFVNSNENIKDSLLSGNPFMFTDGNISYAWDGYLSYNLVLSEWISDYINELKDSSKQIFIGYNDFLRYLKTKYKNIFEEGIGINDFISTRNFVNIPLELLNYKYITNIIIESLNPNSSLKDFCNIVKNINLEEVKEIKTLIYKDNKNIEETKEQREIFDYVYIELSKKIKEEDTLSLKLESKIIKEKEIAEDEE